MYVSWSLCHFQTLIVNISSVLLLTRSSAIAMDVTVLFLTWIKTFQHWRRQRQLRITVSVTDVLIRDGRETYS